MTKSKLKSRKVRELIETITSGAKHFSLTDLGCMAIGDSRELSKLLPDSCIDAIVTSPPYYDLKDYGGGRQIGTGQAYKDYLKDLSDIFSHCYRACKKNGSLWMVVDTFAQDHKTVLLPFELTTKLELMGWSLKEIVIWQKDRTVPWSSQGRFRKTFEYILMFTKSDDFKFYGNRVREKLGLKRWWVRYPERYNPEGKMPTDIWFIPLQFQGAWGGKDYPRHLCPFPFELVERILTVSTNKGNFVLDPFAGTGSVLAQAHCMSRCYLGFELKKRFLNEFEQKTLTAAIRRNDFKSKRFDSKTFKSLIMMLRGLKYPSVLIKEYRKLAANRFGKSEAPYCALVLLSQDDISNPKIPLPVDIRLAWHKMLSTDHRRMVHELMQHQPLSLFGISPRVSHVVSIDALKRYAQKKGASKLYVYTVGNTHKHRRVLDVGHIREFISAEDRRNVRTIPILSNIPISVDE